MSKLLAGRQLPDADFADEVRGGQILVVGAEDHGLDRRHVRKRVGDLAGLNVENLDRWLGFGGRFVLDAPCQVLSGGRCEQVSVGRDRRLPRPKLMGGDLPDGVKRPRKYCSNSGRSPRRSRSGGISMSSTLRR